MLASDWYGCGDISQLKNHHDHRKGETSHAAATGSYESDFQDADIRQDDYIAASASFDYGEFNLPTFFEAQGHPLLSNDPQLQVPASPLPFLFSASETEAEMNDMVKEWLADSGYDQLLTGFEIGDRGTSHT